MLRLLAWGRRRWPISRFAQEEEEAAVRLLAGIPYTLYWMADLGCGVESALAATRPEPCIGIDRSYCLLKKRHSARKIEAVCADVRWLPLTTNRFELVLAVGVAEYCTNPEPLIKEAARILMRDGWLLFSVSPEGWHTCFRSIIGAPIYIHQDKYLEELYKKHHLKVVGQERTVSQHLFLLQKRNLSAGFASGSDRPVSSMHTKTGNDIIQNGVRK